MCAFFLSLKNHEFKGHMRTEQQGKTKSLIFLTGFMGSGKSTVGPILSNTLGYKYIDLDRFIEQKVNKKVVEIFSSDGEQAFRILERSSLEEIAGFDHCVVSLGGGTISQDETYRFVSQKGILIYLKLSPEEILRRVQFRNDRPMLKDDHGQPLPPKELEKRVLELLARREPFYARANVVLLTDNMRVGVTVDEIMKQIRGLIEKE
jgi:shikimate kinase